MKVSIKHIANGKYLLEKDGKIHVIEPTGTLSLEQLDSEWELREYRQNSQYIYLTTESEALARQLLRYFFKLGEGKSRTVETVDDGDRAVTLGSDIELTI